MALMTERTAVFHGMHPWGVESEIIYCEQTALGEIDLHNAADFLGVSEADGGKEITLQFEAIELKRRFNIRFGGIRKAEIISCTEFHRDDKKLFYAFNSLGDGVFEFEAAIVSGTLEAEMVTFEVAG
ncbi:hypothetical protein ACIBTP_42345 [Streptomyces avidinii]|uniref:hypothetical protein n=1 Tax=Streptomyces avidinii TaxID=1895 RepID=UPI0037884E35